MEDYDKVVAKIDAHNKPILDDFRAWLKNSGLAAKTIKKHLENLEFFADYLTYYEPLSSLDEADEGDVYSFLSGWYPRKAMWASPAYTRSYMASFRKFFKFMVENGRIDAAIEADVRETLKRDKEEFLDAVEFDDDYAW